MDVVQPSTPDTNTQVQAPKQIDALIAALDRAYARPWLMLWRSFLHGLMVSLGATVGAALVLLALGWFLMQLDWAPMSETLWKSVIPESVRQQLDPQTTPDPKLVEQFLEKTLQNQAKEVQ